MAASSAEPPLPRVFVDIPRPKDTDGGNEPKVINKILFY